MSEMRVALRMYTATAEVAQFRPDEVLLRDLQHLLELEV